MRPYNQFDLLGKRKASVGNDYFNQSRIFMAKASSELGNEKRIEKERARMKLVSEFSLIELSLTRACFIVNDHLTLHPSLTSHVD